MKVICITSVLLLIHTTHCAPIKVSNQDGILPAVKRQRISASPRCNVLISEVSLGSKIQVAPFIELLIVCPKKSGPVPLNVLAGYKLLIIKSEPISLVTVVDFNVNVVSIKEENTFIVIGAPSVPNINIPLNSRTVQNSFARSNFLPRPTDGTFAVVVCYDSGKSNLKSVQLYTTSLGYQQSKFLTTQETGKIQTTIVDSVVLSNDKPDFSKDSLRFLWQSGSKMGVREWEKYMQAEDKSLSNCGTPLKAFDESWELSAPTPGTENNCKRLAMPVQFESGGPIEIIIGTVSTERSVTDVTNARLPITSSDGGPLQTHNAISRSGITLDYHTIATPLNIFKPGAIPHCKNFLPKRETLLTDTKIQSWLKIDEQQNMCLFGCAFCQFYLNLGFRPDYRQKSKLQSTGYFSNDVYENAERIRKHPENFIHKEAVSFVQELQSSKNQIDVNNAIAKAEDREIELYNATMNMVLLVYTETYASLSFRKHETLTKSIRLMGTNIGTHLYSDSSAANINKIMSNTFHTSLVNYLLLEKPYFSILVDESTNTNQALLIVYIQTVEEGMPISHFYALLHLSEGETGAGISGTLISKIKEDNANHDGFEQYFKDYVVSIVTDGASAMTGDFEGFKTYMMKYIHRIVPNVHCLNHKLELSIKRSFKAKKDTMKYLIPNEDKVLQEKIEKFLHYIENFEKKCNKFYTFYSGRGHKRWNHLQIIAEKLNIVAKRLRYFYDIRWSSSHFEALLAILHDYNLIVEDLKQILVDKNFDDATKQTAAKILNLMTDKTYIIILHEFIDFLKVFTAVSKEFQVESGLMVGRVDTIYELISNIQDLQKSTGTEVGKFIAQCTCPGVCTVCTYQQYEACPKIVYGATELTQKAEKLDVDIMRAVLYKSMEFNVRRYFEMEKLQSFDLFNPALLNTRLTMGILPGTSLEPYVHNLKIPTNERNTTSEKMDTLCDFYSISKEECKIIKEDWNPLVSCLVSDISIQDHATPDPSEFWPFARTRCSDMWKPSPQKLIQMVLVTPFSSSQCERGFSLVNNIRTKERSSMDVSTLDGIVRIKANGPKVEDLDCYYLSRVWLKQNHIKADEENFNGGKKQDENKFPSLVKKSRILQKMNQYHTIAPGY